MQRLSPFSLLLLTLGSRSRSLHAFAPPSFHGRYHQISTRSLTSASNPLYMAKDDDKDDSKQSSEKKSTSKNSNKNDKTDRSELSSATDWLDAAVEATMLKGGFDESSFLVGILGDLHIDPRKMEDYEQGRDHWMPIFDRANKAHGNTALVSLGDLGESKNCNHNPDNPDELFAGTTLCHEMAAEFLGSFGLPYEVVGGKHTTVLLWAILLLLLWSSIRNSSHLPF